MRPARVVAAVLLVLAAGLAALLVFGPTEGAEATPEAAVAPATSEATTTEPEPLPPATSEPETTTEEVEPPPTTTTEPEPEPAEPPRPLEGDGTFPEPIRMTLVSSEIDWETARLEEKVRRVRVEARVTALVGSSGSDHGLECGSARVNYSVTVDPWGSSFMIIRWNSARSTGVEIGQGQVGGLVRPPHPNALSLTCVSSPRGARIALAANGGQIVSTDDNALVGRFTDVGVTASSGTGVQDVVFDGVVVKTG